MTYGANTTGQIPLHALSNSLMTYGANTTGKIPLHALTVIV